MLSAAVVDQLVEASSIEEVELLCTLHGLTKECALQARQIETLARRIESREAVLIEVQRKFVRKPDRLFPPDSMEYEYEELIYINYRQIRGADSNVLGAPIFSSDHWLDFRASDMTPTMKKIIMF